MSVSHLRHPALALDRKEFGEIYHVAAALFLDKNSRAAIVGVYEIAQFFLPLFAHPKQILYVSQGIYESAKKRYRKASRSTGIYCSNWTSDVAPRLETRALAPVHSKISEVEALLNGRIDADSSPAALLWIRNKCDHEAERNSTEFSIGQVRDVVIEKGMRPIFIGDSVGQLAPGQGNLIQFYKDPLFANKDSVALQLLMFRQLMRKHGVRLSIGMMSGGMDGPGLFLGLPTISFAPQHKAQRRKNIEAAIDNFFVVQLRTKTFQEHLQQELNELRFKIQQASLRQLDIVSGSPEIRQSVRIDP